MNTKRVYFVFSLFIMLFGAMITRLFLIQVVNSGEYEVKAARQHAIREDLYAKRGEIKIHEKNGYMTVATQKDGYIVVINPTKINNPELTYEKLASVLEIEREEFLKRASKIDDPFEIIYRRATIDERNAILALDLKGVSFVPTGWRSYPAGALASNIIGFVGDDADGNVGGKYGLERRYDSVLSGKDGVYVGEESLGGKILAFGKKLVDPETDGVSLITTVESGVQAFVENEIKNVAEKYDAASAGVIVMDPRDGRIIAMASLPTFDPNYYYEQENIFVFRNKHVENVYEMGSVFKALTMAAGIDAGVITKDTTYYDAGSVVVDNAVIENFDGKGRGKVPMQEILSQSLNTGAVFIMKQLGKDAFREYVHRYGLAEKTGIDMPNEVKGNLKNLESPRNIEYATASFGQGIAITPIAFVRAIAALANGGILVEPHIVEAFEKKDGTLVEKKPHKQKRILKKETSEIVTRMLINVVDGADGRGRGRIKNYSVAAKTGTAEIARNNERGYSGEYLHTFFAYGPAYDPEFLIFLYLEKPKGVRYASQSLTEPYKNIMKFLFSYFEVAPDRVEL